jgi:hypothetical protein
VSISYWLSSLRRSPGNSRSLALDNGDDSSAFGRQANFGGFDSPTPTFGSFGHSHSRVDSNASADSFHSFRFAGTSTPTPGTKFAQNPAAHSSSSSVNNFQVPRKASFASLRSHFRSAKPDADTPPVPPLNEPFNQSISSQSGFIPERSRQTSLGSLHHSRVPSKTGRAGFGRQTSQSGSIFQSDNGSNPSLSTPPLPRRAGGLRHRTTASTTQERPANTPSDYALSVVFHRFVTSAEALIDKIIQRPLDDEPYLPDCLGPGVDKTFDGLLDSLGRIAQRHTNAVIDCIIRWRRMQNDIVPTSAIKNNL